MNRRSIEPKFAQQPGGSPREEFLTTIGLRFKEIRGAKRFASTSLAKGWAPRAILARAFEMCQRFYAKLPNDDRELMTDLVMSAVSCTIADWLNSPDPSLTRINEWIDKTVASNCSFVRVSVAKARTAGRA